jgi:hypothetical protein
MGELEGDEGAVLRSDILIARSSSCACAGIYATNSASVI